VNHQGDDSCIGLHTLNEIAAQTLAGSGHPFSRRQLRPPNVGQFVDNDVQCLNMVIAQRRKLSAAACGALFRQVGEQGLIVRSVRSVTGRS
jgi:hypothetical protein